MKQRLKRLLAFRYAWLVLFYTLGLTFSLWLAYELRFDFKVPQYYREQWSLVLWWIVPLNLALLVAFRLCSGKLTVFSTPDLFRLAAALGSGFAVIWSVLLIDHGPLIPPRGVLVANLALSFLILGAVRLGIRTAWERSREPNACPRVRARRIGIVGAGDVGAQLARELLTKSHLGFEPVVFFDDDRHSWNSHVHGVPVVGPPEVLFSLSAATVRHGKIARVTAAAFRLFQPRCPDLRLDEAIIAMPSAPARRIGEVVNLLQRAQIKVRTIPSLDQLATGAIHVSQVRPVEVQDLLGREPVEIDSKNIHSVLAGKVVMVTGAGGSIGSELCRQIATFRPSRLLLVEQSEAHMFQIEQDLIERGFGDIIEPCIANVLDRERICCLFERWLPQIVFHAAAHKHVPMMEEHPGEAIKNNTMGTAWMAQYSIQHDVERFVLISTDKAINPTSVMGASKRLAEMFIQALHAASPGGTRLMGVRFGNVLGSSGSVIPTFSKQIAAGGPVKVTHPEITRYFMTIPEAVSLVLQSCAQGEGGEIFVLDMGKPVRIIDLARQMITLSGLKPGEDIEIQFTGLRPGEKLYEELCHDGENITPTAHPKIMRFVAPLPILDDLLSVLNHLSRILHRADPIYLKRELQRVVPEYRPYGG